VIEWEIRVEAAWIRAAVLELGQAVVVALAAAEPAAPAAHAQAELAVSRLAAARPDRAQRADPRWWQAELGRIQRSLAASGCGPVALAAFAIEAGTLTGAALGELAAFLFAGDSFVELAPGSGASPDEAGDAAARSLGPLPFAGTLLLAAHPRPLREGFAAWMAAAVLPSLLEAADALVTLARGPLGSGEVGFVLARPR
jgi:hypothetical protein